MSKELLKPNWSPISPRANQTSESYITGLTNQISNKIEKGQVQVSHQSTKLKSNMNPETSPNVKLAMRQKMLLQRKLGYLNKQIEREKAHSAMGKIQSSRKDNDDIQKHQIRMKEIIKKEKEMKIDIRKHKEQKLQKKLKIIEKQKEKKQQLENEEQEKRKQKIMSKIQQIQERMSKRQEEQNQIKAKLKSLMNSETLHEKLLKQHQAEEAKALDQRKRKLQQLKNQHKPIDTQDIIKHQQKFMSHKKDKEQERVLSREQFASQKYHVPYESVFYKKVKGQKPVVEESDDATLKREKMKEFDAMVKDKFRPSLDRSLLEQSTVRLQKQNLLKQNLKRRQSSEEGRKKGLQYLSRLRSLPKVDPKPSIELSTTSQTKYQNYLTHNAKGSDLWKQYFKKMKSNDPETNIQQFLSYSEAFERKLFLKEQKSRILREMKSEDVDEKYIDMINAKLEFFNMNKESD